MSSITKCLNAPKICRKVARCDKKLCLVLIEADIFNKAVQANIPKPLRNLYIKFDVNALRQCGEMACVEEHLRTSGNSDITTQREENATPRRALVRKFQAPFRLVSVPDPHTEQNVRVYETNMRGNITVHE